MKNGTADTESNLSDTKQKIEMQRFVAVMIVFSIGMAFLLFFDVSAWWIWYIYFMVWTYIEYKIAKNIKLKWWHWMLIILGIVLLDWMVLELVEYLK